jgi:hypothetical protein
MSLMPGSYGSLKIADTSGPDEGLMKVLRECEVSEDLIDAITYPNGRPLQMKTLTQFYFSIDSKDLHGSVEALLMKVPLIQVDTDRLPMEACRLCAAHTVARRAWEFVQKIGEDAQEDPERPLPDKVKERLDLQFRQVYNFTPVEWLAPSGKTKARMWRMLQPAGHKEVFPMDCLKPLSRTTSVAAEVKKKIMLQKGVALDLDQEKDVRVTEVWEYYCRLKIWAYAMAWAGSDKAKGQNGAEVRQCPLEVFMEYAEEAYKSCMVTQDPLKWIRERDETTRAKMISFMQNPETGLLPGEALQKAREYLHNLWDVTKETAKVATSATSTGSGFTRADFIAMARSCGFSLGGGGGGGAQPLGKAARKAAARLKAKAKPKAGKGRNNQPGSAKQQQQQKQWTSQTLQGENLCPGFNMGSCKVKGAKCNRGLHQCNRMKPGGAHCGCKDGFRNCKKA